MDLLDALPDGVVIADGAGRVVRVNDRAARMLHVDGGVAAGQPLADVLLLQDTEARTWSEFNQPWSGLHTRTGVPEQSWILPDGSEVLVAARIHREGREIIQIAVTLRSGRGRARLDRERSDLVATVAHELRSPLTGVKGFVQALINRWDKLNDDQKKLMLATVHSDADRLSRLIAELLDVARIDTGRLQLYPRACAPELLVGRVVESVRQGTSRPVELEVDDDLPEVLADPDKFTQVVTNLVENAVRHGDGTVTVRLQEIPAWADFPGLQLTVDDQGTGIPDTIRQRVFTKFWKHGERGGSGLGMYLVNGLVRAHGGQVEIEDAPGGGARIVILWPSARD
ncbi:ATP-binding protein [Nocardioides cavernaquae]|uniref:sensor histidine kinase n=1 Tax=Nocardioides cavernaquae TaxID=2321396 RepID=UPI001EE58B43|nr:ATP-binding protein [Nocardioides cavernaquae]